MSTVTSIKHFTRGSSYCYKAQKKGTFKKFLKDITVCVENMTD